MNVRYSLTTWRFCACTLVYTYYCAYDVLMCGERTTRRWSSSDEGRRSIVDVVRRTGVSRRIMCVHTLGLSPHIAAGRVASSVEFSAWAIHSSIMSIILYTYIYIHGLSWVPMAYLAACVRRKLLYYNLYHIQTHTYYMRWRATRRVSERCRRLQCDEIDALFSHIVFVLT